MTSPVTGPVERLLIWRMGSIGDAVVALPVFHLLARAFANAERRVLTNLPVNGNAAPLQAVLGNSGLADGYFAYPMGTRNPARLLGLRHEIASWRADLAICLNEPRNAFAERRDRMFLRWCGVRRILAVPAEPAAAQEAESQRLAGLVAGIGKAATGDPAGWRLNLTEAEQARADALVRDRMGERPFIALGIGTKIAINEWGDDRWRQVLAGLTADRQSLGLVLIGGPDDGARSRALAENWRGPVVDLCGRTPPRISAAAIGRARLFLGPDSGPMHLAASVGTPSVVVFSTHNPPGRWFPFGAAHRIFYPGLGWSGGDPVVERPAAGETEIGHIPAAQVLEACRAGLAGADAPA